MTTCAADHIFAIAFAIAYVLVMGGIALDWYFKRIERRTREQIERMKDESVDD